MARPFWESETKGHQGYEPGDRAERERQERHERATRIDPELARDIEASVKRRVEEMK